MDRGHTAGRGAPEGGAAPAGDGAGPRGAVTDRHGGAHHGRAGDGRHRLAGGAVAGRGPAGHGGSFRGWDWRSGSRHGRTWPWPSCRWGSCCCCGGWRDRPGATATVPTAAGNPRTPLEDHADVERPAPGAAAARGAHLDRADHPRRLSGAAAVVRAHAGRRDPGTPGQRLGRRAVGRHRVLGRGRRRPRRACHH